MTAPARRCVAIVATPSGYALEARPTGQRREFTYWGPCLRAAARQASEWRCSLVDESGIEPVAGDLGPIHLLGKPRVYVVAAEGDSLEAILFPGIWGQSIEPALFYDPGKEATAHRYAKRLVALVRTAALAKEQRLERQHELKAAERERAWTGRRA